MRPPRPTMTDVRGLLEDLKKNRANVADVVNSLEQNLTEQWEERRDEHQKEEHLREHGVEDEEKE